MPFHVRRLTSVSALALLLSALAAAQCPSGGTTYTGGQGIATLNSAFNGNVVITSASPYPATLVVPGTATGTITSLCVTISGLNASSSSTGASTQGLAIALKSPSGRILGIMGNTSDGNESLSNVTLNITDSASGYMPDGSQGKAWPSPVTSGTLTDKPSSFANGFSDTVFPSLGTLVNSQLPLDATDNQGSKTLSGSSNGTFFGDVPAGTWGLYVVDSSGFGGDNISFVSWSLTLTVSQSNISTTTTLSSSTNPSFASAPNNSVTLTANVLSSGSTPTGTVAFSDGTNTIAGCGAVALAGGVAHCTTAFTAEGTHALTASYTTGSGSGFTGSSTASPLYQYVKHHSTSPSAGLYCNTGSITMTGNIDGTGTSAYPSVVNVGTDTPALASSVATVSLVMNGLSTSGAEGSGPIHALLISPDGNHTLEFMSGAGDNISQPSVNLTWADSGSTPPNFFNSSPLSSTTYHAFSEDTSNVFPATVGGAVPALPGSYNFASPGGGVNAKDFAEAFNGAASDGDWKLFIIDNGGSNTNGLLSGGWCLQITQASGTPTITTVSGSPNPAVGVPVIITATVRNANTQAPVTEGSVTFTENGNPVTGGPSGPVAVSSDGTATFTATSLPQGDHTITATYSDGGGTFNLSFGTIIQRVDNATPTPTVSGNVFSYCNGGSIQIPGATNPTDKGPGYPNPSNIFVAGLPGQTSGVSVTLNNFSHLDPQLVDSLIVGPGGQTTNTLDFFSGAGGTPGTFNPVNLTFSDSAAAYAPASPFALGTYTYKPTSYIGNDSFAGSQSGFYPVPLQIQYAGPIGSHTLNGTYAGTSANDNGTWSLFFNQTSGSQGGSVGGGWCVNFTQTRPQLLITKSAVSSGSMTQGETGFTYNIAVTDSGPGPTGGVVTVTDVPSSGLTISNISGTGWSCSSATCTRSDALAAGNSYPVITVTTNVASNAASPQTNYATVSGGGAANTPQSNTVSTTVLQSTTVTASNATVPFSTSDQNVTLSATVTAAGVNVNGGTVSFTVVGLSGTATSGTVTSGTASVTFTVPGGTAASTYQISATYNPAAAYASSSDSTHTLTVQSAGTTTIAANATVPFSSSNQNVTLAATVTSPSGTVTSGTVTFSVNGLGSATSGMLANGSASVSFPVPGGSSPASYQITATYNPGANLVGSSDTTHSLTIQSPPVPATVASLSSTTASGTYGPGTVIPIQVTFSKAVSVAGTPLLSLNDGGAASYSSGSGTATLTFNYTVATGQNTTLLNATSLNSNGGAIMDLSGTAATLTLPAVGAAGSLGVNDKIAIDTISPQVVKYSVNFGSNSYNLVGAARSAHLPWTITSISVTFSAPIGTANAASLSGITATSLTGLGTNTLTWTFPGISNATLSTSLAASGVNAIQDAYGNTLGSGTNFTQNFSVLYGDFNGDGSVTATDMTGVNNATKQAYNQFADINGDGIVATADTLIVKQQQGAIQH